jgi:hypothetical protein
MATRDALGTSDVANEPASKSAARPEPKPAVKQPPAAEPELTTAPAAVPEPELTTVPAAGPEPKPETEQPPAPAPEPKPAPPAEVSAPPAPAPLAKPLDWPAVITAATKQNAMLTRLKNRSRLVETTEKNFTIEVFDNITQKTAEGGREQIEAAVARAAKRPLRMNCRLNEDAPAPQRRAAPASAEYEHEEDASEEYPREEPSQIQETFNF